LSLFKPIAEAYKHMKNHTRISPLTLFLLAALPLLLLSCAPPSEDDKPSIPSPPNDWRIGNDVRLCKGTQIREAPAVSSCYHTIVPENNWVVRVIGGPVHTNNDGKTWYDTSRRAAGDPSGGTGWVNIQQTAICPAPDEGGTRCPYSVQPTPTPPTIIIDPKDNIVERILKALDPLLSWWLYQPVPAKIAVVIVALLLLPTTRRLNVIGGTLLGDIARAILLGVALGGIADLTRPYWQDAWTSIVGGTTGFDLAVLLLIAPLLWWALGFVSRIASRAIGIIILLVLFLILLAFVAPDRLEALLDAISGIRK
jgi:hypothetical protein